MSAGKLTTAAKVAGIALLALALFSQEVATAQNLRGGGFGGGNGGFRPGGFGGDGFLPPGPALGFGFSLLNTPRGDEGPSPVRTPRPRATPTGDLPPPRHHPHHVVVAIPPTDVEEPDDPVQTLSHAQRPPRHAEKPRSHPTPQPTLVYAKPPVVFRPKPPALASRALLPLAGETRYRASEVLVEIPYTVSEARVADVLRRHRLTQVEAVSVDLLGLSLRRWKFADARTAIAVVNELALEAPLLRVQPNYLFAPADDAVAPPVQAALSVEQYALVKMKVVPALENAAALAVRVAVIDTAIDEAHPDLKGVVGERFDAIGDGSPVRSRDHGTAMAGGIAADGKIRGVAKRVNILSARAFDTDGSGGALGSTLSIVKAVDWSAKMRAQVVNMSFAGPNDPTLHDVLAAANARGIALVGAAGNAGPNAPPQFPGADANVIAATATDADDKLFSGANIGPYVALAAPGVDVLLPAPDGGYALETGTSVSSALVAGVVALMLEGQPGLKPLDIRQRLTATATPLGGPDGRRSFGAGLIDASKAVTR